jgi:hypothetical protein
MLPLLVALAVTLTSGSKLDVDGGVKRTARAVRAATAKHGLDGQVWLGKLRGVGGGRDTLVYVPRMIDRERVIDVVVYMEGIGSFADDAMDHRHAASIARLRGNFVYVAPDAPSSSHGQRAAKNPYWVAGCADRACPGGHAASGDFLVFLDEVRTHIASTLGVDRDALVLRHSLIGFSRGGKGVGNALGQLADARFVAGGHAVQLADVIFADGNYGEDALDEAWRILENRPEAPRLTILVGTIEDANRRRANAFSDVVHAARTRVVPVAGGHHAIGDAAVDFLPAEHRTI